MADNNVYLEFTVRHEQTTRTDSSRIASGTRNTVKARFTLLDDWIGITPVAVFTKGGVSVRVLTVNGECGVPNSMTEKEGQFSVCVYGGDFKTTTTEKAYVAVVKGGYEDLEAWSDDDNSYILSLVGTVDKKIKYIRKGSNGKFEYSLDGSEWFTVDSNIAWLPSVTENGELSWTHSDSAVSPEARNIKGRDGHEAEFRNSGEYIQWRYVGDEVWVWRNLIAVADITGADGQDGSDGRDGANGKSIEIRTESGYLQWRYGGDDAWNNLIDLARLTVQGTQGIDGKSAYEIWLEQGNAGSVQNFFDNLKGDTGATPRVTVVGTETGEANTPAKVENVGTDAEVKLEFTIPQGKSGVSPKIAVKTSSENEYILRVTTESGSFDTINLNDNGIIRTIFQRVQPIGCHCRFEI